MSMTIAPDDVRQRADWMRPMDDPILEFIDQEGNVNPQTFGVHDVASSDYAGDRLPVLGQYGLVEKVSPGLYRLTETGRGYLDGEVDASELEPSPIVETWTEDDEDGGDDSGEE